MPQRINNVVGQLQAVTRMMEEEKDTLAVFTQLKAARSALNTIVNTYIEEEILMCLSNCKHADHACSKLLKEAIQ